MPDVDTAGDSVASGTSPTEPTLVQSSNKGSSNKATLDIRTRSWSDYNRRSSNFYFSSSENDWLCKICTSFSQGQFGNGTFIDQPEK